MTKARSTASSLTAVKFPHSKVKKLKNSKLATLKQMSFLNSFMTFPFGSVEVLPHPSGNALKDSETKASVKLPRLKQAFYV